MYRDSYVRTCSKEFRLDDDDLSVHLTNDAVQKHLDSYGAFEDANKLSYAEFEARRGIARDCAGIAGIYGDFVGSVVCCWRGWYGGMRRGPRLRRGRLFWRRRRRRAGGRR